MSPLGSSDFNLAIIGNHCNFAFWCWSLRRNEGKQATLYLTANEYVTARLSTKMPESLRDPKCLVWNRLHRDGEPGRLPWLIDRGVSLVTSPRLFAELSRHDGVLSFCTAAMLAQFSRAPYVAVAMGSDLKELAVSRSLLGQVMARGFRGACFVMGTRDAESLRAAEQIGLIDYRPVRLPINTKQLRPASNPRSEPTSWDLVILHPSRLDWTYEGRDRHSTKGNDRFFRALARVVAAGLNPMVVVLRRGVDVQATEELVEALGLQRYVQFRPEASQDDLVSLYQGADVVVDQFDIGAMGAIALEAMACAKPVMVYVQPEVAEGAYDKPPPVLSVQTEDEIFNGLMRLSDPNFRSQVGQEARAWIKRNHSWETFITPIIEALSEK